MSEPAPIVALEIFEVTLAYRAPVVWTTGGAEAAADYLVLRIVGDDGLSGAAEVVCKPAWNGMTPAVLAKALAEIAWPAIRAKGLPDAKAGARLGHSIRDVGALATVLDNACRDLFAARGGAESRTTPLRPVPSAALLTRDAPDRMAEAARHAVEGNGHRSLKIKLGQGLSEDAGVLSAVRAAVGPDVLLTGDANGAYGEDALDALMAIAADTGLAFLEDPCPIQPLGRWRDRIAGARVPILLDRHCASAVAAEAWFELGATHVAAKPGRIGLSEAEGVVGAAARAGGHVCLGMFGESAAGVFTQLRLAAGLVASPVLVTSELGFHQGLADSYLGRPIGFSDGCFLPPDAASLADLIDWDKLAALSGRRTVVTE
jgi:L-alanine-DL-glutamate epimerase-like enolase superfamily enzyme